MSFCYTLSSPKGIPDSLLGRYMLEDLNRYFPIKGRIEKRKVPCWIMTADSSAKRLLAAQGGTKRPKAVWTADSLGVLNASFSTAKSWLSMFKDHPTIVDETHLDPEMLVDFVISMAESPFLDTRQGGVTNSPPHFETLKDQLNRFGLDLYKGERIVPILVIYDE